MPAHTYLLEPPYTVCRIPRQDPSPLGSVLIADLSSELVAVVEAADRHSREPWCPVVLVGQTRMLDRAAETVLRQFQIEPLLVHPAPEGPPFDPPAILSAVQRREPPSPHEMAQYVVDRTGRTEMLETLAACFSKARGGDDGGLSRSTLCRRLSDFGPHKARDWTGLGRVIWSLLQEQRTGRRVARGRGMDPRTLRSHVQHLAGMTYTEASARPGWEWLIESALRRAAYVALPVGQAPAQLPYGASREAR